MKRDLNNLMQSVSQKSPEAKQIVDMLITTSSAKDETDLTHALSGLQERLANEGINFKVTIEPGAGVVDVLLSLIAQLLDERLSLRALVELDSSEELDEDSNNEQMELIRITFLAKLDAHPDYYARDTYCTSKHDVWGAMTPIERLVRALVLRDHYFENELAPDAGLTTIINSKGADF